MSRAHFPTPVTRLDLPAEATGSLWLKDDGVCHEVYGGNKVRKVFPIIDRALERGARRILTLGAAGSHHVLATTVFGRERGLSVAAVLWPHPWSAHGEDTLRAAVAQGLSPIAAPTRAAAVGRVAWARRRGDYFVNVGGLSLDGTRAYVDAIRELKEQIDSGALPEPDQIVVPVGTGTTAAGLLAGALLFGLRARILGVLVASNPVARPWLIGLAAQAFRVSGEKRVPWRALSDRLVLDRRQIGRGYGHPTAASRRALEAGPSLGLGLDGTYTAKALARALEEVRFPGFPRDPNKVGLATPRRTLYWHTLSGAPLAPLLENAAAAGDRTESLSKLFIRGGNPVVDAPG